MERDKFNQLAQEVFGERVSVHPIPLETLNVFIEQNAPGGNPVPFTQEQVDAYGEWVWAPKGLCAVCGANLHMSFQWGFVHGVGQCTHCEGATYRFYHRVQEDGRGYPFMAYALIGWADDVVKKHGLDAHTEVSAD